MPLSKFELYHGAVLTQAVRNPGFNLKLFERTDEHGWGEYEISDNHFTYRLIVKSTSSVRPGRKGRYYANFTFSINEVNRLRSINGNVLVCLVCANQEICVLEWEDITALGIVREQNVCNVIVSWEKNTALHVKSKHAELPYTVPRNKLKTFNWV